MKKLILEIPNQQDLDLILSFAKRLKAKVIQIGDVDTESSIHWLEELSKIESFREIKNPVEWQRNIRADRKLPFRD